MQNLIIIAIIGLVGGVLSGVLGIGGAIVIIPALVFVLGFSQQMAQGTTLLMMVPPIGALAAYQYYIKGLTDVKTAAILAATFIIGGYLGARVAVHLPAPLLKRLFALLLVGIAVKIWFDRH